MSELKIRCWQCGTPIKPKGKNLTLGGVYVCKKCRKTNAKKGIYE
jgi:Zn finger protein HypA/HybF involved in hydrogenase expression